MTRKSFRFFFAVTLLWATQVIGSNFHEHLFSLPFPSHISQESEAIFGLPESVQQLSLFSKGKSDLKKVLSLHWNKRHIRAFLHSRKPQTIRAFCEAMPGCPIENLRKLLTLQENGSVEQRKRHYIFIEDVRKQLLLELSCEAFCRIYTRYFKEEPVEDRQVISATVTRRFFSEDQTQKRRLLQTVAKLYSTNLVLRISLQRNQLLRKGLIFDQAVMDQLINGEIEGVDIVGSLTEDTYDYPYSHSEMKQRLHALFDFISSHNLVLVFHLFECLNNDSFYFALKEALLEWKRPLLLEVGHIANLNQEWIDTFASLEHIQVLFHANIESNHQIHGLSHALLKQTVDSLLEKGMPVVLGSDGRGIFPNSAFSKQRTKIDSPFSSGSFLSSRALLPHNPIQEKSGRNLIAQYSEVKEALNNCCFAESR